jgi:hypothetical protein
MELAIRTKRGLRAKSPKVERLENWPSHVAESLLSQSNQEEKNPGGGFGNFMT